MYFFFSVISPPTLSNPPSPPFNSPTQLPPANWYLNDDGGIKLCGNSSGAGYVSSGGRKESAQSDALLTQTQEKGTKKNKTKSNQEFVLLSRKIYAEITRKSLESND